MNEIDRIKSLITGLQRTQPRIYEAFSAITKALDKLDINLDAIKSEIESIPEAGLPIAPNVLVFTYSLTRRNIILRWEQPDSSIFHYIVKRGGTNWDDATHLITTATLSAVFDPLPIGITRYWIKGMDFDGNVSETALALDVNIPPINSFNLSAVVIDNNVLLNWTIPVSTWDIAYYNVYREAALVGRQDGTFAIVFETAGGTYLYRVFPVDLAGNIGPEATVSAVVRQPPDFDLIAQGIDDLSGTKQQCMVQDGKLIAPVAFAANWSQHFQIYGYTTPEQQINAGYPIYIHPSATTGLYIKVFDFGGVFDDVILNLSWSQNPIYGTVTVSSEIRTSIDNVNWTPYTAARSLFVESMRYVEVKITFTSTDFTGIVEFYDLRVDLNVKSEMDSGQVTADKDDVGGTLVMFNKVFKDISSITVTADSIEPLYIIYDFLDIPNPVSFKVLVYDSSGSRVDYFVSWKARGIT